MLHAKLMRGVFQDSVTLMMVSRDLSALPSVRRVAVMMGTPANKDVYRETGLWHEALADATPNDLCVVVESEGSDPVIADTVAALVEARLAELARGRRGARYPVVRSWRRARQLLPNANVALISIGGHYASEPARRALEDGCNVMLFSDNVPLEQELELKTLARAQGLLLMGPDCGTAILHGAPLAFANRIPPGPIAVVGASGTGIQELTSQIARLGGGVTHALGLGGRDLSERIGGMSAITALDLVARDPATRVVAFVSKPPAPKVKREILGVMQGIGKPVVALFLGERPARCDLGSVHLVRTLDAAAALAVDLARVDAQSAALPDVAGRGVCGLYAGGTLAAEAALLLAEALDLTTDPSHAAGTMLRAGGHRIIDLGDDAYTRGRPHPMIDPSSRHELIQALAGDPGIGVLLLDVVLGYGAHADPAGEVARAVVALRASRAGAPLVTIATVTGTDEDPQDRGSQARKLEEAGIVVADSVRAAVLLAIRAVSARAPTPAEPPPLLRAPPSVVNIGLRGFADDLQANGIPVVHQQWEPVAGGDERLRRLLARLQ